MENKKEDMFVFLFMILPLIECGKHLIQSTKIKNNGQAFVIETKPNQTEGSNEETPPDGENRCSHHAQSGPMLERNIFGCGGSIAITCTGGCIRIHMALFNCVSKREVNPRHLHLTKVECEGKESCFLQPSEEFYGKVDSCQNKDDLSTLWLTYSCDGGTHSEELKNQCQDPTT